MFNRPNVDEMLAEMTGEQFYEWAGFFKVRNNETDRIVREGTQHAIAAELKAGADQARENAKTMK